MPVVVNDRVLDFGLSVIDTEADRLYVCSAQPTTYTEAVSAFALGQRNFGVGAVTGPPAAGFPNGRAVTVSSFSDGTVTNSGSVQYWSVVDTANQRLLATGPVLPFSVTAPAVFSLSSFDIIIPNQ